MTFKVACWEMLDDSLAHGIKLKGYYPYFGVQPSYSLQNILQPFKKGRGNFL
jgi:hypothetical protein